MTKMEEESMAGEETKVAVPGINMAKDGAGEASFPEHRPPVIKQDTALPPSICSSCREQILDKYYMKVDDRCWHEKCVHCVGCQQTFTDSCFSKNGNLYCRECYKRLQCCCYRCTQSISVEEYVMRVGKDSYHIDCFFCDYCNQALQKGDEFHSLHDSLKRKICCKKCYDMDDVSNLKVTGSDSDESLNGNEVFSPGMTSFMTSPTHPYSRQLSDFYPGPHQSHMQGVGMQCSKNGKSASTSSMMTSSDSKRTKRPRTILTTAQRRKFKASFEISQKPCRKVRETLASETGLTPRVVQVWFQNQRAKMKKIARRQNQGDGGTRRKRSKKDVDSDSENEVPSSPGSYTSAPTPHQPQYFGEYQSPRSVQSTPTQDENAQRVFSPNYHQQGFNHAELQFEDYSRLSHAINESPYIPPTNQPPHSPSELEMHKMLHERVGAPHGHGILSGARDVMNHDEMNGMHFSSETIPEHYMSQHPQEVIDISNERPLGALPSTVVSNPIDSLMYMQSNFFST